MWRAPRSQVSGMWLGPVAWQKWLRGLFLQQIHCCTGAHTFALQAIVVHTSSGEHMYRFHICVLQVRTKRTC
jgi:hypothetical protein